MSITELRRKLVGRKIARIDGRDTFRGPTVERIVLDCGTELRFDWRRGAALERGVGLDLRGIAEAPRSRRGRYVQV